MILTTLGSNASLLRALGWSLFHFLWQGAILAVALAALLRITHGRSSQLRYLASCVVFGLMALCPACTFVYLAANADGVSHAFPLQASAVPLIPAGESSSLFEAFAAMVDREMPWILAVWCAGVLLLLTHLMVGSAAAERLKRASLLAAPETLQTTARRLAKRLHVSQPFRLFASTAAAGPIVVGWLRPVILLPLTSLAGLTPEQLEVMLAHELAHIRRYDYLVNTLQAIAEALLFYHPAVWWVSKRIRQEREHCCDDVAVTVSGSPLTYAKALSLLEEQRSATTPQLTLGANGGDMAMRIKRILGRTEPAAVSRGTVLSLFSIATITIGALFLFADVAATGVRAQSPAQSSQAGPKVVASAKDDGRPSLACTYYGPNSTIGHPGTCAYRQGQASCTANYDTKQSEIQIGCLQRLRFVHEWELRRRQNK